CRRPRAPPRHARRFDRRARARAGCAARPHGGRALRPLTTPEPRSAPVPDPTRVVIAEDEAIIRLDLKELLEEEGYEVVGETGRGAERASLERDVGNLAERLEERKTIDRAKGVLMDQHGKTEQEAWRFLQQQAMHNRVKVHDVARRVVDGEVTP